MNKAMRHFLPFSSGNTVVVQHRDNMEVFLHGNHIATYNYALKELELYDGGWQSVTTKSRLNALCYEFATGFSVFQKNWDWFVSDFQSKTIKPFCDGLIVDYSGCF